MFLTDLLAGLDAQELGRPSEVEISDIVHDDRRVTPGSLFACMPGTQNDGHDHAPGALANGAAAILVERPLDLDVPQVLVPSVRAALGPIAARLYGDPTATLPVYGVTGTNGKTTVTYLLEAIIHASGLLPGAVGTTGVRLGDELIPTGFTTPEADELQRIFAHFVADGVGASAMEVSSHALSQSRVAGTHFAAVGFTNLSHDHLDFHGTMDAYFDAKAALCTPEYSGRAAILVTSHWGAKMAARARAADLDVLAVGEDLVATDVVFGATGTTATITDRLTGDSEQLMLPLVGPFNLDNALVAIGMWVVNGGTLFDACNGCRSVMPVPGRMERIDVGQAFGLIVDYAHTPDALEHVLHAAREMVGAGRVIVVAGCGGDRDQDKRAPMGALAAKLADVAIITSDNPRSEDPHAIADAMVRGARDAGHEVTVELDRRAAIEKACAQAAPGDVVVIAGKGHETGQTANGISVPFDDRIVAREVLEA